jgi:hypothetical protein
LLKFQDSKSLDTKPTVLTVSKHNRMKFSVVGLSVVRPWPNLPLLGEGIYHMIQRVWV